MDISQLGRAEARLAAAMRAEMPQFLLRLGRVEAGHMRAEAAAKGRRDLGRYAVGWAYARTSADSVRVYNREDHAVFAELGRRPGKPPPVAAISGWAARHGVPAFPLALAIGRRGIKPQPVMLAAGMLARMADWALPLMRAAARAAQARAGL